MREPSGKTSAINALLSNLSRAKIKSRIKQTNSGDAQLVLPSQKAEYRMTWNVSAAFIMNNPFLPTSKERINTIFLVQRISRKQFEWARNNGIAVIDAKGNGVVSLPGFHMEVMSELEKKDRIPSGGTPFTKKASRIVRALLSKKQKAWSQSELVHNTRLTQAYVSIVLKMLVKEGYIAVQNRCITLLDDSRLLDEWTAHYRFDRHKQKQYAFNASSYDDGLVKIGELLKNREIQYAFTGWSGSHLRAPYGIAPLWMAYIEKDIQKPEEYGFYPVVEGGNLVLLAPQDSGVFQFTNQVNGLNIVSDAQVYVDLKKMPGRAGEQADMIRQKYLS